MPLLWRAVIYEKLFPRKPLKHFFYLLFYFSATRVYVKWIYLSQYKYICLQENQFDVQEKGKNTTKEPQNVHKKLTIFKNSSSFKIITKLRFQWTVKKRGINV